MTRHTRTRLVVFCLAGLCLVGCLLVHRCFFQVLDGEGWVRSAYSIENIGLALRTYHEVNGTLPPTAVHGKNGEPLLSWRVLLLSYLGEEGLYKQFHLDEPWDSPHNRRLAEKTPRCYVPAGGGNDAPGLTRYQVFVGPGTPFEREGLTWHDFPDGLDKTILVAEAGVPVPWSKPADLVYDPERPVPPLGGAFTRPVCFVCYEVWRTPGFNAAFADGAVRFIGSQTEEPALRGVITRNGGEKVDVDRLE
jgi:hypothetical protein